MAAAIRVENAALGRIAQPHRHIQRTDRQILFHPVADSPANDTAAMQIKDDGKIEPALLCPDIGDVASLFAVGHISGKVTVEPVCCDTQARMAVRRNLVLTCADGLDPVDPHEAADPALANVEPGFLQLHRHSRTAVAAKAQAILFPDMGQHPHVRPLPMADRTRTPGTIAALAQTGPRRQAHSPAVFWS